MPDGNPRDGGAGGGHQATLLTRRQRSVVVWRLVRGCAIALWRTIKTRRIWRDHDVIGVTVQIKLTCEKCHGR